MLSPVPWTVALVQLIAQFRRYVAHELYILGANDTNRHTSSVVLLSLLPLEPRLLLQPLLPLRRPLPPPAALPTIFLT